MTTSITPIDCDEFARRLADFLEHEVDEPARAALELHALGCAGCDALLADLRRLRVEAAELPDLEPSRDLWPEIAARIDAPVISINTGEWRSERDRRRALLRAGARAAGLAASLLLAAGLGGLITYGALNGRTGAASPTAPALVAVSSAGGRATATEPVAARPAQAPDDRAVEATPASTPASLASNTAGRSPAEETFDVEIARLRTIVDRRRAQLDPATVSVVERNLRVIDDAIAQCRSALEKDPASRFLIESLNHALENKVELLRTAAMLPSRT